MELSLVSNVLTKKTAENRYFADLSYAEKTTYLKEQITPELIQSMRDTLSQTAKTTQARPVQENDGIPKVAPKWLKHDRQVSLRNVWTFK